MPRSSGNRVGIVAIAKQLGISTTTVHAALTGSAPVAEATRERVRNAAAALGYHPNLHARALRTKKSQLIGMIAQGLRWQFFGESFEAFDMVAAESGYTLLQAASRQRAERERAQCEHFLGLAADALIIVDGLCTADFYNAIATHLPLLFLAQMPEGTQADYVTTDEYRGGWLAGEHLARSGRRRIIFLAPPPPLQAQPWVQERLRGCTDALRVAGLADPVVVPVSFHIQDIDVPGSHATLDDVDTRGVAYDGIFAANDNLAYGMVNALLARGVRVPDDVAVVGYDNVNFPRPDLPPLTTVAYPFAEIGVQGMQLLLRRIQGEETGEPKRLRIPPILLKRTTA